MAISFDKAFGTHAAALQLRSQRASVLSANLANADTPHYRARDFDFRAALDAATGAPAPDATRMTRTSAAHLDLAGNRLDAHGLPPQLQFREPLQPVDGNSVDVQTERAAFTENAVRYQASLNFLNGKIQGLRKALTGE